MSMSLDALRYPVYSLLRFHFLLSCGMTISPLLLDFHNHLAVFLLLIFCHYLKYVNALLNFDGL